MASAVLPSGSQCAAAVAAVAAAAAPPGLRLRLLLLLLSAAALIPTGRCGHRPVGPLNLLRHPSSHSRGRGKRFHDNLPPLPKSESEGVWRGNSGLRWKGQRGSVIPFSLAQLGGNWSPQGWLHPHLFSPAWRGVRSGVRMGGPGARECGRRGGMEGTPQPSGPSQTRCCPRNLQVLPSQSCPFAPTFPAGPLILYPLDLPMAD